MKLKIKRNTRKKYFLAFIFLLIVEILIAIFIKDEFIRPYLGDFLVVILIYCFVMAISKLPVFRGLLVVLLFSFAVEFFQLINIMKVLQYQPPKIVMTVLGSSFSLWDLFAYVVGLSTCFFMEYSRNRTISPQHNPAGT